MLFSCFKHIQQQYSLHCIKKKIYVYIVLIPVKKIVEFSLFLFNSINCIIYVT